MIARMMMHHFSCRICLVQNLFFISIMNVIMCSNYIYYKSARLHSDTAIDSMCGFNWENNHLKPHPSKMF